MSDVIFLFDSQTQGADKSNKPNLCLPHLSFKLMICRRLHLPPKKDIVYLSPMASFSLQHKLDWWSDSLLIRLILQSTCAHETRTACFSSKNRVLPNPDGVLHQKSDHMRTKNGSIPDSTCGGISDRSSPGDMQMQKNQDCVKVKPMGDLHLTQPVVKPINFPPFKLVNGQIGAIRWAQQELCVRYWQPGSLRGIEKLQLPAALHLSSARGIRRQKVTDMEQQMNS